MAESLFTANASAITINGERVPGVRSLDYAFVRAQESVYALGSGERVAVYYGAQKVEGRITVASAHAGLDGLLASGDAFQVVAQLGRRTDPVRSVAFDECFMTDKAFALATGGHAETVYAFTATRVREEDA
jgi:hypothetical protein